MIRELTKQDFEQFWPTFEKVIMAQETYAFKPDMTFDEAYNLWCETSLKSFVYEVDGVILGTYYLRPNAQGPSDHISNCGYMVGEFARGKGIAKSLCQHSQKIAVELGFKAMQFNSVVSTNDVAVKLWQKLGFSIIGTVPNAYRHARLGLVDSFIMFKTLGEAEVG